MSESWDVVIVGGAVVGSAAAYFLAGPVGFRGRVLVVEKDPTYAECATARSAGGIRQQFSTAENIALSSFGAAFVKSAHESLAVDGDAPALPFVENGYLFLATETGLPVLQGNHALQRSLGADIALLDPDGLQARFPWLSTEGLAGGTLGLSNEGWTDPYSLLQAFRRKARSLGVTYVADTVTGLEREGGRVAAVQLAGGGRVACGTVVDCAGVRGADVAAMAGLALPVRPRKRIIYVFDCREQLGRVPLVIDPSGVWFRPEHESFIGGVSPPESEDPDCLDFELDYRLFEEVVWPTIAERVPAFEAIKLVRAWAGHYDYNTLDQNAIVGPHPEVRNFLFANGFSGHGLQQSPAVGRALAELITHGGFRSIDLTRFSYERVLSNQPIIELNVV
jgi:sarcosine oxidase